MSGDIRVQVSVRGEPGTYFVILRQTDGQKTEETIFGPYGRMEPAKDFAMQLHEQLQKHGGTPTFGTS